MSAILNFPVSDHVVNLKYYFTLAPGGKVEIGGPTSRSIDPWSILQKSVPPNSIITADDIRIYEVYHNISKANSSCFSAKCWKVAACLAAIAAAALAISVCTGVVVATPASISILAVLSVISFICAKKASNPSKGGEIVQKYAQLNGKLLKFTHIQLETATNVFCYEVIQRLSAYTTNQKSYLKQLLIKQIEQEMSQLGQLKIKGLTIASDQFQNEAVLKAAFDGSMSSRGEFALKNFKNLLVELHLEQCFPELQELMTLESKNEESFSENVLFREKCLAGDLPRVVRFINWAENVARLRMKIQVIDMLAQGQCSPEHIEALLQHITSKVNVPSLVA